MNTTNEMTTGEMMIHFRIAEEHYDTFSKWLTNNAVKLELVSPNNTKKIRKIYLVDKVEQLFPDKHLFNTRLLSEELQAAAELLSNAIQEHSDLALTPDEILKVLENHDRKSTLLSTIQNYLVEMIKWHDKTCEQQSCSLEHRNSCWRAVRRINWLTVAYIGVLILNLIISICL